MSRRSSLQCSSPQPNQSSLNNLLNSVNQNILHSPRLTTLSSPLNTRTQRLGSQPTLFYSSPTTPKYLKSTVGGSNLKMEKMPPHLVDNPNQISRQASRQQRRSQPSIFAAEMHPQLMAIKSGPLGHSQPMLYFDYAINGSTEFMQPLKTPPPIHRAQNSNSSSKTNSPGTRRKLPLLPPERRILRRSPQSDLFPRFQQHRHQLESGSTTQLQFPNEILTQTRLDPNADGVDPIYLALKQATGKYGAARRGSSNQFDSATPSPRNLSQISLQDSGYAEATGSRSHLVGSTPQLHQTSQPPTTGAYPLATNGISRPRAPKLNKQMKSLSLDCAESTPPVSSGMRSQFKSKPIRQAHGFAISDETSDWERSVSPTNGPSPRRLPVQPTQNQSTAAPFSSQQSVLGTHIVSHEYTSPDGTFCLYLGDRLRIIDNRDNDWFHGFRTNDRLQQLLTFPSTCVASMQSNEQPMKLIQNAHIAEAKLRFYRDQVVFAQPDSMRNNTVLVRNERNAMAYCPIQYLMLL